MKPQDLENLILDLIGPGEASPFELASEICDLVPSDRTRDLIAEMVMDGRLKLTRDFTVRLHGPNLEKEGI